MFKGLSLAPFNNFFTLNTSANTLGHIAKIVKNRCRLNLRLFFFSWNLVCRWRSIEWCMTVCSMTRSKVKVTSPWESEIRLFSKAISSIY